MRGEVTADEMVRQLVAKHRRNMNAGNLRIYSYEWDIHRHIFGNLFAWAGKLRTVNISKGDPFCNVDVLDIYGAEHFVIIIPIEIAGRA